MEDRPLKIVVLDGYTLNPGDCPWAPVAALGDLTVHDRTDPAQLLERASGAEVLATNKTPLNADAMEQLGDCRFITVLATGVNVVDINAARRLGITVSNVPEYSTDSVAQHVFALLLHRCMNAAGHDAAVREGRWEAGPDFQFTVQPLIELAGKTMGIVGFGRIGRRVGELAHAFGMNVIAHSRTQRDAPDYPFHWRALEQVFEEADVVSLHCPLTEDNAEMVDRALLNRMKPDAMLINTARGGLINESDLAEALRTGRIAWAGLDVVSAEPIRPDSPLKTAPNCLITPHIAWATVAARQRLMRTTADNIAAYQKGEPINVVN